MAIQQPRGFSWRHIVLLTLSAACLHGCASAPEPLRGEYQQPSAQAMRSGQTGQAPLLAGGEIIATEPKRDRTCFEILQRPLDSNARPRQESDGGSRFLACRTGFYDPAVFEAGREITVLGRMEALVEREIGEYLYTFPQINADVVYLWPERQLRHYDRYLDVGFGYPAIYWPYRSHFGFGLHYRVPIKRESTTPAPPADAKTTEGS